MKITNKVNTPAELQSNFAQIKPLMSATMAHQESSRCLFCYDAPCIKACPTEIDIPLFIRQINTGHLNAAAKTIYDSNYFAHICGKVCPTEVLCEGACVFNEQDVPPIEIGRLQSYAASSVIANNTILYSPLLKHENKKVAVIGSGPAGISCACELRMLGYTVEIFEAKSQPSGLALHGTAPYKITNKEVLDEVAYLQDQFGFLIHFNTKIDSREKILNLEENYDAIFLGVGLGTTRNVNIIGENLKNCIGAIEYIEELKTKPMKSHIGKKVVIIGGGNTAMDAASEASRLRAENVFILYRRSKEEMGAYDFELELAKSVGAKARFNIKVIEIVGDKKVTGLRCVKTESINGVPTPIEGSEFGLTCDLLIKATGQKKQTSLFDIIGLEYDQKGSIKINEKLQCSSPKYFAAGDAVNGGREAVHACAEAKKAAQGIDKFLNSNN